MAFKEHLPNTYIHTCSVEAVLAPIAQQLSNLIMIVAKAERAGKAIRDLSSYAVAITKACNNLVAVG
jgi:vinculin